MYICMYFRVYVFNFLGKLGFNVLKYILETNLHDRI